jgi:hypothetical protein
MLTPRFLQDPMMSVTFDSFSIPINIRCGLPYINMHPHTDQEWEELPHVLLTEDANSVAQEMRNPFCRQVLAPCLGSYQ